MSSSCTQADLAISARRLGKCFNLYARPQDRLKQALWRWRKKRYFHEFWALHDVSFDVKRGECLGVIGRNGSGKSTLLQLVAGTLTPNQGEVQVRGRVTALLELGGSFNPEFTGRENVFMNGAVLGVARAEVENRFDEIVQFAEIGEFLDQPVKTYSSGMFVRLAFAVQVLMKPDILIVDEALAVGDVAFQFKCIARMKQLRDDGVTVLLVTHDVQTIRTLCDRAIWLHEGKLKLDGEPGEVSARYLEFLFAPQDAPVATPAAPPVQTAEPGQVVASSGSAQLRTPAGLQGLNGRNDLVRWGSGELIVESFGLAGDQSAGQLVLEHGHPLRVEIAVRAVKDLPSPDVGLGFAFRNNKGLDIIAYTTHDAGHRFPAMRAGEYLRVQFELDNILMPGDYALVLSVEEVSGPSRRYLDFVENVAFFKVVSSINVWSAVLPPVRQTVVELPGRVVLGG